MKPVDRMTKLSDEEEGNSWHLVQTLRFVTDFFRTDVFHQLIANQVMPLAVTMATTLFSKPVVSSVMLAGLPRQGFCFLLSLYFR